MLSGVGYDVHSFVIGEILVLGGVQIEHDKGLVGHSDGDALIHAIIDSILGAAGLGDIGIHFPSDAPQLEGIASTTLLKEVKEKVESAGYGTIFIDATIIAQNPRMRPYISSMKKIISRIIEIDSESINIKATTTDGLGFIGREEGIACLAISTLEELK